jgi:hypothetical protein
MPHDRADFRKPVRGFEVAIAPPLHPKEGEPEIIPLQRGMSIIQFAEKPQTGA